MSSDLGAHTPLEKRVFGTLRASSEVFQIRSQEPSKVFQTRKKPEEPLKKNPAQQPLGGFEKLENLFF
jgi:hypothetical protein